jgi:hypothetical protein
MDIIHFILFLLLLSTVTYLMYKDSMQKKFNIEYVKYILISTAALESLKEEIEQLKKEKE